MARNQRYDHSPMTRRQGWWMVLAGFVVVGVCYLLVRFSPSAGAAERPLFTIFVIAPLLWVFGIVAIIRNKNPRKR